MGLRLIFLLIFLAIISAIVSFTSYKKYYDPSKSQVLSTTLILAEKKQQELEHAEKEHGTSTEEKTTTVTFTSPEEEHGYKVFTEIGKCYTCHGKEAQGLKSQLAPKLAGQFDWYLYEQLTAFKNKIRLNTKMDPYIKKLSDDDFKHVALYLSKLGVSANK
ncbi:MAG: c-type cytochrome [Bacteriovoracaceae bacterium]|nr:c-type cytochrome [Bacteriovoracaceae bacterium]